MSELHYNLCVLLVWLPTPLGPFGAKGLFPFDIAHYRISAVLASQRSAAGTTIPDDTMHFAKGNEKCPIIRQI